MKLRISTEIKNVNKFTIQRCAQLVERTNQFNLTNNRYEANEILNFIKIKMALQPMTLQTST